jgi:F-type H+-transporting ATPase subunit b
MKRVLWCAAAASAQSLGLLGLFFLLAASAFAQESSPSAAADTPTGWVFRWLNFAIVFAGLVWAFSKAKPYFRRHAQEISDQIAEGTRARSAAEKQRAAAQAKLARVDDEVAELRAQAKRGAEAESKRIAELASSEAENIERSGQAEIAATERAARIELKNLAAERAVELAEAVLRQELTPQKEAALFRTFVTELEGSPN